MKFPHSVLVLGAHPDDEMGCAGFVRQLVDREEQVRAEAFSECSDLNGPELRSEWDAALREIGVQSGHLYGFPNRRLHEHRQDILDLLVSTARIVLVPATFDAHQDHAVVTQEAIRAFKHSTILGYELPVNAVASTHLQAYVALSPAEMTSKLKHAQAFRSQSHKPYMDPEFIRGLARVRGTQCGTTYAEAFEVIRWMIA